MENTYNLELLLTIASYMGKFPYRTFSKKSWRPYVYCWCVFSVSLNVGGVMFEIRYKDRYFFYMLPIIVYLQWMLLNVLCCQNSINYIEKWKKILSAFSKYDKINPNAPEKFHMKRHIVIIVLTTINTMFLITSFVFTDHFNLGLALRTNWIFHMYMIELTYAIILEILILLKKRYKEIKEEVAMWHRSSVVPKDCLENLIKRYRILYEISTSTNEIFGKVMLILLANTFAMTIDFIGIMLTVQLENGAYGAVQYGIQSVLMVLATVYILSYYDGLEKIGKEIVKLYCIHEVFNGASIANLVQYFSELSPRFTADEYFSLNKTLMPSLLAGIATYVIVMLQLKPN